MREHSWYHHSWIIFSAVRRSFFLGFLYPRYYIDFYIFVFLLSDYHYHLDPWGAPWSHLGNTDTCRLSAYGWYDETCHVARECVSDIWYSIYGIPNHGSLYRTLRSSLISYPLGILFSWVWFSSLTSLCRERQTISSTYLPSVTHHILYLWGVALYSDNSFLPDTLLLVCEMGHSDWCS